MATEKIKAKRLCICDYCIQAIRSHGEEIFVGDRVSSEEENLKCEFCDEEDDELFECLFED